MRRLVDVWCVVSSTMGLRSMGTEPGTRPVDIAVFLPSLELGGVEQVLLNLSEGFVDRGFAVELVLADRAGVLLDRVDARVPVVDLRAGRILRSVVPLAKYLHTKRPAVLVTGKNYSSVVAIWARRLAGVQTRITVTMHGMLSCESSVAHGTRGRMVPMLMKAFYPWANSVIAVSEGVRNDVASVTGLSSECIEVIYNPVLTPSFYKQADEPVKHPWFNRADMPIILGAGRLVKVKGFDLLIKAFALVRSKVPSRLVIIGEGEERPALEGLIRESGLEDAVDLPGYVPNPAAYMAKSGVFVLSSAWESLPTVVIESLAVNTPVVATDCKGGIREILQDGLPGRIVADRDPGMLAEAIVATLTETCKPVSLEALQDFTLDAAIEKYIGIMGLSCGAG